MAGLTRARVSAAGLLTLAFGGAYALVPLVATGWFSLRATPGRISLDAYTEILADPDFQDSLALSVKLACLTIVLTLTLVTVTACWVQLKAPHLRQVIDFVSILSMVLPPVVLVVALLRGFRWAPSWFYGSEALLVCAYAVLALPYAYRIVSSRLDGINIRTLTEAARSLGASRRTVATRVILPNVRSAILSAAFMTFAVVLGEFTIALIMQFNTYAVYVGYVWESRASGAAALSVFSFVITWAGMLAIMLVGTRLGRKSVHTGGIH